MILTYFLISLRYITLECNFENASEEFMARWNEYGERMCELFLEEHSNKIDRKTCKGGDFDEIDGPGCKEGCVLL